MGYAIKRKREHIDFIKKLQHTEDEFQKTNDRVEVLLKSSSAVLFNVKATGEGELTFYSLLLPFAVRDGIASV